MKKLVFLNIVLLLLFASTFIQAEEEPTKTAVITIQDDNGHYVDLSKAEIHLKNTDINVLWNMKGISGWDVEKTKFTLIQQGVELTTSTDEALNIDIYLDNGTCYYVREQLDFHKFNNVSLNLKSKELKMLDLSVSYPKNIVIGYDLGIPEFFDRMEGQYEIDTNRSKRIYTNTSSMSMIFGMYDDGYYHIHKETIAINNNMTKSIVIQKTDKYKQTITYSSYYEQYKYMKIQIWDGTIPGIWYELHNGPIVVYSNISLLNSSSVYFTSLKGSIYETTRSTEITKASLNLGEKFSISSMELDKNYDGSKSMRLSINDEYKNLIRFIDIERKNDYKYEFYTMDGKIITSGYGSLYWTYLDKAIKNGKYMFKVGLNKANFGTDSIRYFLVEIISDNKWKITDEEGNYTVTEVGIWTGKTGKDPKPDFSLIRNSQFKLPDLAVTASSSTTASNTASDVETPSGNTSKINDLKATDWFYNDVTFLLGKGVINGFTDNTFRPSEQVKVDAFIKMIVVALGYKLQNGSPYWAQTYIDKAIDLGVMRSDDFDSYTRPITRGEMAKIAANIINALEDPQPYQYMNIR